MRSLRTALPAGSTHRLVCALLAVGLAFAALAPAATAEQPDDLPVQRVSPGQRALPVYDTNLATFEPTVVASVQVTRTDPVIGSSSRSVDAQLNATVGWGQGETSAALDDTATVAETFVKFDLTGLDLSPRPVSQVFLRFDETADRWTGGSGAFQEKAGCVARLGISTVNRVEGNPITNLFPHRPFLTAPNGSAKEFDVTGHVLEQLASPENASLRYGYVLRGAMDLDGLSADDNTNCLSILENIRLEVTLGEGERPKPTPTPRPSDLSIRNILGREDLDWERVRTSGGSYIVELHNEMAAANGVVVVDIETSGVVTLGEQIEVLRKGWAANGFTCAPKAVSGGANAGLRCTGGSIGRAQTFSPAVVVRFTGRGFGAIHASISASDGRDDPDTGNNGLALNVQVS